jgi:serine/threonine-protein kinase
MIGGYRILHQLGRGGMADVHLGFHERLKRHAAIKILRSDLGKSADHQSRFLQEAQSAAALIHPNIVQVYDVGDDHGHHFIAQEYIPGSTLSAYIKRQGRLAIDETLSILLQVAAALQKASVSGIVHRDIKPENILLTREGEVKVADFGLARILGDDDAHLTQVGVTMGTPMYMSPEQIQGKPVDARSDLYSLGATAYCMLIGKPPFSAKDPLALAVQHLQNDAPDPKSIRSDIPQELSDLVLKLLAKDPEKRFESPAALARRLQSICASLPGTWKGGSVKPLLNVELDEDSSLAAETVRLQSVMLESRVAERRIRLLRAIIVCLAVGIPVSAFLWLYARPVEPLITQPKIQTASVPRLETIEQQYFSAVAGGTAADWRAVDYYFPIGDPGSNFQLNVQSRLRLAREYREQGDLRRAQTTLERMLAMVELSTEMRVISMMELATAFLIDETSGERDPYRVCREARQEFDSLPENRRELVLRALPSLLAPVWNSLDGMTSISAANADP